ncbi:MAG: 50S ribosomal protein L11 methyltransferase [Ezakiella sp.]|nr:50S ribosomal protein L11 methyltransferase [Ezakiella sp.]MDD7472006.1 50S ribosomal protein L11 methyltransferase [Bacillota bacterium]MDY3923970.1 50S ribosomal protein L11 methyltransferase [Ezakiella sp.]
MIEISIKANRVREEEISTTLLLNGITAFEVVDTNLSETLKNDEKNWDYIDNAPHTDFITFKFYVGEEETKDFITLFKSDDELEISTKIITKKDYENDWKNFFHTIKVSDDFKIVPLWEEHTDEDVVINPGMAFGTGSHETTLMCLKEIDKHKLNGSVMDVGTGSGILAISMAKRFGAHVDAYEIDALAIKSAEENIELNGVKDKIHLVHGDFRDGEIKKYDAIVSNIYAETLCEMMNHFAQRLFSGGIIILSGIVAEKEKMVEESLYLNNFEIISRYKLNGWAEITGRYNG